MAGGRRPSWYSPHTCAREGEAGGAGGSRVAMRRTPWVFDAVVWACCCCSGSCSARVEWCGAGRMWRRRPCPTDPNNHLVYDPWDAAAIVLHERSPRPAYGLRLPADAGSSRAFKRPPARNALHRGGFGAAMLRLL